MLVINTFRTDTTEFGYVLGQPNERETAPSAERYLSPSSCSIIRALMHSSFLWSSCTNEVLIWVALNVHSLNCV